MLPLKKLVIKPTTRCFHQCGYCKPRQDAYSDFAKNERNMSISVARTVILKAYEMGARSFVISGGDALMYPDFPELLSVLGTLEDAFVIVNSTATTLDLNQAKEFLRVGVGAWNISVDSALPKKHDASRGVKGAFEKSMDGLSHLLSAQAELGTKTFFNFMTVLTSENYQELPMLINLAVERKISSIYLMKAFGNLDGPQPYLSQEQIFDFQNRIVPAVVDEIRNLGLSQKVILNAKQVLESIYPSSNSSSTIAFTPGKYYPQLSEAKSQCDLPDYYMLVQSNGDVLPCCALEIGHDPFKVMGNIHKHALDEIWMSNTFSRFRRDRSGFCVRCAVPANKTLGLVDEMCQQFLL